MDNNTSLHTWAENGYFINIMKTFPTKKDTDAAPNRALIYSYHPDTDKPIVFRHYKHIIDDPKEIRTAKKIHKDCCTVYIFVKQSAQLIINGEAYIPNYGCIAILRKDSVFQPIFFSADYYDYYEINFPEEYFETTHPQSPVHSLILGEENANHVFLSPSKESLDEIFHVLKKIDHVLEQNHKHKDCLVYSYLMRLFAFLDCNVISEVESTKKLKSSPIIRKATEYITENYITISGVDEVANHCHISVSYLCRIFKKQLGISPTEFINSRKIIHSKHLLKKGYNVMDVCFASGFNSYNYFIALFKKSTGQTPVKYRKLAAEQDLI